MPHYSSEELKMKTNQEAFDHVWHALNKQGKPCANLDGCWYRKDGNRCAGGHLIKADCEHLVGDHDLMVGSLITKLKCNPFDCDPDFVRSLQIIHDFGTSPVRVTWLEEWRKRMCHIAETHNLVVPGVQ